MEMISEDSENMSDDEIILPDEALMSD